jgi:hypothetical protein
MFPINPNYGSNGPAMMRQVAGLIPDATMSSMSVKTLCVAGMWLQEPSILIPLVKYGLMFEHLHWI